MFFFLKIQGKNSKKEEIQNFTVLNNHDIRLTYPFLISANNPNESLGDFLTPTEEAAVSGLLPNTGSATAEMAGKFENLTTETETKPKAPATRKTRQTRTSQRQLDRELKEEAERIRKENQLLLKKEKEAMKKQSLGQSKIESDELMTPDDSIENNQTQTPIISPTKATVTPTTASGR